MLIRIKQYFKVNLEIVDAKNPFETQQAIQLACAALLIEVSKADFSLDAEETLAISDLIRQQFDLDPVAIDSLLKLAQEETDHSVSLYQFTRLVNDYYNYEQKLQLMSAMWQVAYADGDLDKYEEHLIRKVAELIYVSHKDFIRLKLTANATLNSDTE